jgi:hypothetical protein
MVWINRAMTRTVVTTVEDSCRASCRQLPEISLGSWLRKGSLGERAKGGDANLVSADLWADVTVNRIFIASGWLTVRR